MRRTAAEPGRLGRPRRRGHHLDDHRSPGEGAATPQDGIGVTRRYISIAEAAAEYLNVSDKTVRRLIADGELTGYRIGRKTGRLIRVDLDEIGEKLMRPIGAAVRRD